MATHTHNPIKENDELVETVNKAANRQHSQRQRWAVLAVAVFVIIVGVISIISLRKTVTPPAPTAVKQVVVNITSDGFQPSSLLINKGTEVVWRNQTASPQKLGSTPFPTHSSLPGLFTEQAIGPNSTYSYTFNNTGNFSYADYLVPTINATVTVK